MDDFAMKRGRSAHCSTCLYELSVKHYPERIHKTSFVQCCIFNDSNAFLCSKCPFMLKRGMPWKENSSLSSTEQRTNKMSSKNHFIVFSTVFTYLSWKSGNFCVTLLMNLIQISSSSASITSSPPPIKSKENYYKCGWNWFESYCGCTSNHFWKKTG